MADIVTVTEFAYAIRLSEEEAEEHLLLLELAEGLVVEKIGDQDPWPTTARAVVLAVASRAYFNPKGRSSSSVGDASWSTPAARVGVYLTDEEIDDLVNPGPRRGPSFSFPGTWPYPDPVERPADIVSG